MAKYLKKSKRYTRVAQVFHWVMALALFGMLVVGFTMVSLPLSPKKLELYNLHKMTGITLLALVTCRIMWRVMAPPPAFPASMHTLEKFAAYMGHMFLYVLMLYLPVTGWLMTSAAGLLPAFGKWFVVPALIAPSATDIVVYRSLHVAGIWVFIALLGLHISAALWHYFVKKDEILARMVPLPEKQ